MNSPDEKRQLAVALAYGTNDGAPRVVARGSGMIARAIIEKARSAGVVLYESEDLSTLLMGVDLDHQIPEALYFAVAEVLVWVRELESAKGGNSR